MNTKLIGFARGLLYPIVMLVLAYIIQNLGASGIFPATISTIIVAILGVVDHQLEAGGSGALFGTIRS